MLQDLVQDTPYEIGDKNITARKPSVTPYPEIQLADLIPVYPDSDNRHIQALLSSKWEFKQFRTERQENPWAEGQTLYRHQRFTATFLKEYDRALLFHETGTGKTCSLVTGGESLKGTRIRGVHYIVPSSLKGEVKRQLACTCTHDVYASEEILKNAASLQGQRIAVSVKINKWYQVISYATFAGILRELSDSELIEQYSDVAIFLDEPQTVNISEIEETTLEERKGRNEERQLKRQRKEEGITEKEQKILAGLKGSTKYSGNVPDKQEITRQLRRLTKLGQRNKVVVATATTMINSTDELGYILSFLLPKEKRKSLKRENLDTIELKDMEKYYRGYVSYVRSLDTGAILKYQGQPVGGETEITDEEGNIRVHEYQSVVYFSEMSEYQREAYYRVGGESSEGINVPANQASNIVFPDLNRTDRRGTIGNSDDYVTKFKNGYFKATDNFDILLDLESGVPVKKYSTKYADVLALLQENFSSQDKIENRGNIFIYGEYIKGSLDVLTVLLEKVLSMEPFNPSQDVFTGEGGVVASYCSASGADKGRVLTLDLSDGSEDRPYRYAFYSGELSEKQKENVKKAMNSYENRHGGIIKVFVATPVAGIGISVNNVVQAHITSPSWNRSKEYQAISRFLRATSYFDLLNERPEGQKVIEVKVYKHAAVPLSGSNDAGIDVNRYRVSEDKDIPIKRQERMMKQCAVDCYVNYHKNHDKEDVDYSERCDYAKCNYLCYPSVKAEEKGKLVDLSTDFSTFNLLYAESYILNIISDIKLLYRKNFSLSASEIYQLLLQQYGESSDEFQYLIYMALERMIYEKQTFLNRLGYTCFLVSGGDKYYSSRFYPHDSLVDPFADIYNDRVIGNTSTRLLESSKINLPEIFERISSLRLAGIPLDITDLSMLVEGCILNPGLPFAKEVLELYRNGIFDLPDMTEEVLQVTYVKKLGRPSKKDTGTKVRKAITLTVNEEKSRERVTVHSLYTTATYGPSHSTISRYTNASGRLRILRPSEGVGWRDVTEKEDPVYAPIVASRIKDIIGEYAVSQYYGIMITDGIFRIVDTKLGEGSTKKTQQSRGKECEHYKNVETIVMMWVLEGPLPDGSYVEELVPDKIRHRDLVKEIKSRPDSKGLKVDINKWSDEQLTFYLEWIEEGSKSGDLCQRVRDLMEEKDLIMRLY